MTGNQRGEWGAEEVTEPESLGLVSVAPRHPEHPVLWWQLR